MDDLHDVVRRDADSVRVLPVRASALLARDLDRAKAHRRMLSQVTRLQNGQDLSTVSGVVHKTEINTRLGR
jgi:hypothetical protein